MSDPTTNDAIGHTAADLKNLGDAARTVTDRAGQAGTDALGHARAVAADATARASSLLGTAQDRATAAAETQKQNAADYLEGVAQAVHRSGEALEGHQDFIAQMVERGADELASLAGTLRTNDLQSLLGNLSSLARRQPALFVGASMAAGFTLARVGRLAAAGTTTPTGTSTGTGNGTTGITAGSQPATPPRAAAITAHETTTPRSATPATGMGSASDPAPATPPAGASQAVGEKALPYAMGYPGGRTVSGARTEASHGLPEIIGSLATDLQDLVRGEVRLARAELDTKINTLVAAAISLVGGALVAFAGLVVLLQAAAMGLALVIPLWAAFLVVGLLIVVVGALVARGGLAALSLRTLTPNRTVASLHKDATLAKEHI